MALIDDFINQIADPALRAALTLEVAELKKHVNWGLVFERHRPESTRLLVAPIKVGTIVWERRAIKPRRMKVRGIEADQLIVVLEAKNTIAPPDAPTFQIARADVLVEKPFSEAIFPALTSLGAVRNGPADRPSHVVVEGENYHAIEALLPAYQKQVDVLYLDPPYNTGDKDWAYNNDYVDPNDVWRSSMWLAFMERRLQLGRRLLKDDGVMVVTIDENEVHHLGMLLEQTFKDARIQMASIVINPRGQNRVGGLARVDEQAFFVFFGDAPAPVGHGDDFLASETKDATAIVRWERMIRGGPSSGRAGHPGTFYPVLIDVDARKVVKPGELLLEGEPDLDAKIDGYVAAWPMRGDGSYGRWRIGPAKLQRLIELGYVRLGGYDAVRKTWTILYVADSTAALIEKEVIKVAGRDANGAVILEAAERKPVSVKTIWSRGRHTAGIYGSALLADFIGERGAFSFPKSLYAVRDTLDILVHNKPDALVMDFFAGSGTTLHATLLLNAEDEGRRRCILITNNELNHAAASRLNHKGYFRGDPEFEAAGVFESATKPRAIAAITGVRADGKPVEGTYLDLDREYSEGFRENVEFFTLDYLDPITVEMGLHFRELHPLLWLTAGGIGEREDIDPKSRFALPEGSPYGVLFNPSGTSGLLAALETRPDVTHVFIVADSEASFSDLASVIPARIKTVQLYRNYLETLRAARA
jgi:adenine-specific DNA-methyltransferase